MLPDELKYACIVVDYRVPVGLNSCTSEAVDNIPTSIGWCSSDNYNNNNVKYLVTSLYPGLPLMHI